MEMELHGLQGWILAGDIALLAGTPLLRALNRHGGCMPEVARLGGRPKSPSLRPCEGTAAHSPFLAAPAPDTA